MAEQLHFIVLGEWVTDRFRKLYWADQENFKDVILPGLLLCMRGTDTPKETLEKYAAEVILGKRKFVGNTGDDSYALVEDEEHNTYEKMRDYVLKTWRPSFDMSIAYKALETFVKNQEYAEERIKYRDEKYGWLAPDGTFYDVEFGDHSSWALHYLLENYEGDSLSEKADIIDKANDILVDKGWVLLHNPQYLRAEITRNPTKRYTKAQKEFLYDYLVLRHRDKEAKEVMED